MKNDYDDVALQDEISEDEERILDELGLFGESRRKFLGQVGTAGFSVLAMQVLAEQEALAGVARSVEFRRSPVILENAVKLAFKVNGEKKKLEVDSRMTLLDTLRERLELTGSKKGCDHGQCGACTVILDGERVLSCLTLAATCDGKNVTTIEGIAEGGALHPIQAAFIKYDAFQCGYCTPGQICSSVALLEEADKGEVSHITEDVAVRARAMTLSDDEIRERMSGNLCRCGAYPNIVSAVREVHTGRQTARTWNFYGTGKEAHDETV